MESTSEPPLAELGRDTRLVQDHFDFIWRLVRRLGLSIEDADDVAQQVFMTATQKLTQIASGSERTYLYGVALRTVANYRRKAHRRHEEAGAELGELPGSALAPERGAELGAARALLDEILRSFTPELRRVFVLAHVHELELAEIAELEAIPQGTVASRLRRARALFSAKLDELRHKNPFGRP